ncbi:hypothetical protein [Gottfriedia acidiceleris]|uniref:hypothetical protein n=1 Tax=Gottfriedia acidiceleris TaxID=371036 RepID=UPI002FFDEC60
MFYIECRDSFDEKALEKHVLECLDPVDKQRALTDLRLGAILYPLCRKNDVNSYKNALEKYKECLKEILPNMMVIAKLEMVLKEEDIAFGYFCFEIHSR